MDKMWVKVEDNKIVYGPQSEKIDDSYIEYRAVKELNFPYSKVVTTGEIVDGVYVHTIKSIDDYQIKRAMEYPPLVDYVDGIVKGDQEQIDNYLAACKAVKLKYPKPV